MDSKHEQSGLRLASEHDVIEVIGKAQVAGAVLTSDITEDARYQSMGGWEAPGQRTTIPTPSSMDAWNAMKMQHRTTIDKTKIKLIIYICKEEQPVQTIRYKTYTINLLVSASPPSDCLLFFLRSEPLLPNLILHQSM